MVSRTIFIDPDGTNSGSYVIIGHATGVFYAHQYGGTACRQGELEGYLVPVDANEALPILRRVFVEELQGTGVWSRAFRWPDEMLARVLAAIEGIRFWPANDGEAETLRVDRSRIDELDEGWAPVLTTDGPGVLIWPNSD